MERRILSNVSLTIPNEKIADSIKQLWIRYQSIISFSRLGLSKQGLTHIMNVRRWAYINPEDIVKLPKSMEIQFEESQYWICISSENLTCFLCKQESHTAKHCSLVNSDLEPTTVLEKCTSDTSRSQLSVPATDAPSLPPSIDRAGLKRSPLQSSNSSDALISIPNKTIYRRQRQRVLRVRQNKRTLKVNKKKRREDTDDWKQQLNIAWFFHNAT